MKILAYDDHPVSGGHQTMACRGIEALEADPEIEIVCALNPANRLLAKKLERFEILEAPLSAWQLQRMRPDLVLCIQGDTGQSTRGIAAAKQAGIPCTSYLALPHSLQHMGAKFGTLRDRLHQRMLNRPDRYIVISESMQNLLQERGVTAPIDIVPNGIPTPSHLTPHTSRLTTIGLLGRIEFTQKRQDFMVETFLRYPETFSGCRLLMAGSGPDEAALSRMISGNSSITLQPWQADTDSFYNTIDMLVIPSRYEGVPLVMLEALARGIPVLASRCDGMHDMLPEAWTFEPGNATALTEAFKFLRSNGENDIAALRERMAAEASIDTFKDRFRAAVTASL